MVFCNLIQFSELDFLYQRANYRACAPILWGFRPVNKRRVRYAGNSWMLAGSGSTRSRVRRYLDLDQPVATSKKELAVQLLLVRRRTATRKDCPVQPISSFLYLIEAWIILNMSTFYAMGHERPNSYNLVSPGLLYWRDYARQGLLRDWHARHTGILCNSRLPNPTNSECINFGLTSLLRIQNMKGQSFYSLIRKEKRW